MQLGIFEQSPRQRTIYTQLCFCYATTEHTSQDAIVRTLTAGVDRLATHLPWLSGQVANDGGIFKVLPYKQTPYFEVKRIGSDDIHSLKALVEAQFPFSMLDEKTICPRTTLSVGQHETPDDSYPVFLLQVNFVAGGLLLTVTASHSVLDIVGEVFIIRLLSKACNGIPLTQEEINEANTDRQSIIPSSKYDNIQLQATDSEDNTKSLQSIVATDETSPSLLSWSYFVFSPASLRALKNLATSTISPSNTSFVSTDDCISALIWQSMARARLPRSHEDVNLMFIRQINARPFMGISDTYPGNMVTSRRASLTLRDIIKQSLGSVALKLREMLDPAAIKQQVLIAAVESTGSRSGYEARGRQWDRANEVQISSWSQASCYDLDFGLGLGLPVAVRRPRFTPLEGIVYLLPKRSDGEILAGICLREDDLQRLKVDVEWCKFATWIG